MRLSDLFRPKWKHSDPVVRRKAVAETTDPDILAWVVENDGSLAVRVEALRNKSLSDEHLLQDLLLNSEPTIRAEAVDRVRDETRLRAVVQNDSEPSVRARAILRVTDEAFLEDIALNPQEDHEVRKAAMQRLGTCLSGEAREHVLASFAKTEASSYTRREYHPATTEPVPGPGDYGYVNVPASTSTREVEDLDGHLWALGELSLPDLLIDVATSAHSHRVRRKAVPRIEDPCVLAGIAMDDAHWSVQTAATKAIKDEGELTRIAYHHPRKNVNAAAVRNPFLRDPDVIADLALNHAEPWVRSLATDKLEDEVLLLEIARSDPESRVRAAAVDNLERRGSSAGDR